MAVVNSKSTLVTNADASPAVMTANVIAGAVVKESVATREIAAADDDTSVYRFTRIASGARVSQLLFANDAITGGTSFDCGLYDIAANGGAVVDADLFLSEVDFSSARAQWTDLTHESASNDIADVEKVVWQLLGLTSDPQKQYDVCLTGNTVGSGAGTISLTCRYVDGF